MSPANDNLSSPHLAELSYHVGVLQRDLYAASRRFGNIDEDELRLQLTEVADMLLDAAGVTIDWPEPEPELPVLDIARVAVARGCVVVH